MRPGHTASQSRCRLSALPCLSHKFGPVRIDPARLLKNISAIYGFLNSLTNEVQEIVLHLIPDIDIADIEVNFDLGAPSIVPPLEDVQETPLGVPVAIIPPRLSL